MFKDITWLQFLSTLVVLLVAYYAYLAIAYYPQEIKAFLNSKRSRVPAIAGAGNELMLTDDATTEPEDDEPDTVPDDEAEVSEPKVVLPAASLANLAAVTTAKTETTDSTIEEADETYDDGPTYYGDGVGEGSAAETGINSSSEILNTDAEPIVSKESTSDISSIKNEEDTVNIIHNDEITANTASFGESDAVSPQALATDALPELVEDVPDYSISVTSLAQHLNQVSTGTITSPADLVALEPQLDQTDLLNRLFSAGTEKAEKSLMPRFARAGVGV